MTDAWMEGQTDALMSEGGGEGRGERGEQCRVMVESQGYRSKPVNQLQHTRTMQPLVFPLLFNFMYMGILCAFVSLYQMTLEAARRGYQSLGPPEEPQRKFTKVSLEGTSTDKMPPSDWLAVGKSVRQFLD